MPCIAVGIFNGPMAALAHSQSPVYKVSALTYMSIMFSRCKRYWNTSTSSTSRGQNTSAYSWMRPSSRTWRVQVLCVVWCWNKYSGSSLWHSRAIYQKVKCTNWVTRVIPCLCTVDGTFASCLRTFICFWIKQSCRILWSWPEHVWTDKYSNYSDCTRIW